MALAFSLSKRSTCLRAKVGAVLVSSNHLIGVGYNGAPSGVKHCTDHGSCLTFSGHRCRRTIHAEVNALIAGATSGAIATAKGPLVMYTTLLPCFDCVKLCVGFQVSHIIYATYRQDPDTEKLIKDYGEVIKVERFAQLSKRHQEQNMYSVPFVFEDSAYMSYGGRKSKKTRPDARRRSPR